MLETTVGGDLEECRRRRKREGAKGREGGGSEGEGRRDKCIPE